MHAQVKHLVTTETTSDSCSRIETVLKGVLNNSDLNVRYEYSCTYTYEGVSKSFRTGLLERQLQMVQLCHYVQLYRNFVSQSSVFCVAS
jgi:hypothetical protein